MPDEKPQHRKIALLPRQQLVPRSVRALSTPKSWVLVPRSIRAILG